MNKIKLIILREYLTRVKKKSFVVMTILGPILFAALMIVPAWLASMEDTDIKNIAVIDESGVFINKIESTDYLKFEYITDKTVNDIRHNFKESGYYAVLQIMPSITYEPSAVHLYSSKQPGFAVKSYIAGTMEKELRNQKLRAQGIDEDVLKSIKSDVSIRTIQWDEDGEDKESSTEIAMAVGYIGGFMIYFFIFMFGARLCVELLKKKQAVLLKLLFHQHAHFNY